MDQKKKNRVKTNEFVHYKSLQSLVQLVQYNTVQLSFKSLVTNMNEERQMIEIQMRRLGKRVEKQKESAFVINRVKNN